MGIIETGKLSQNFEGGLRVAIPATAGWSQPEIAFLFISQILKAFLVVGYIAAQPAKIKRQSLSKTLPYPRSIEFLMRKKVDNSLNF
jgi:hypothetical protein